ncbi:MAG: hypothetical protein Q9228_006886, partial [Teloschistes exilis]
PPLHFRFEHGKDASISGLAHPSSPSSSSLAPFLPFLPFSSTTTPTHPTPSPPKTANSIYLKRKNARKNARKIRSRSREGGNGEELVIWRCEPRFVERGRVREEIREGAEEGYFV